MVSDNRNKKTMLDHFDDITLKQIHSNVEASNEFLSSEGLQPDEEIKYGIQQIKKLQFLAKAKLNQSKNEKLLQIAFERLKFSLAKNADKTGTVLKNLLQSKTPSVQYRKLKEWSDDEIREVLNDIDLVRLLEELDDEE